MAVDICREFFASNAFYFILCIYCIPCYSLCVSLSSNRGAWGMCSLFLLFDILLCKIIILYIILGTYIDVVLCLNPWATITLNF